jgi:hypothetical protein
LCTRSILLISDQQRKIALLQRFPDKTHHLLIQSGKRPVDARRIHQDHLGVTPMDNSKDAIAGGLRHRRHNGHLLAHQSIYQRALSRVGPSYNGNKA